MVTAQNKGFSKDGHMLSLFCVGNYGKERQARLKDYSLVEESGSGKVKIKLYRYTVQSTDLNFIMLRSLQPLNNRKRIHLKYQLFLAIKNIISEFVG